MTKELHFTIRPYKGRLYRRSPCPHLSGRIWLGRRLQQICQAGGLRFCRRPQKRPCRDVGSRCKRSACRLHHAAGNGRNRRGAAASLPAGKSIPPLRHRQSPDRYRHASRRSMGISPSFCLDSVAFTGCQKKICPAGICDHRQRADDRLDTGWQ